MFDCIIIGAGIIGCSIARFLAKFDAKILVLEKENDVATGTTKANSGIVHAGFDAYPGSNKARFNVMGAKMYPDLQKELEFPYKKNGAFVLAFSDEGKKGLEELLERGLKNGVTGLSILSGDEIRKMEKNVSNEVVWGLYIPSSGIVSPYEMAIAMAENAAANGVEFKFNERVKGFEEAKNHIEVITENETYSARCVVNATGLYADEVARFAGKEEAVVTPRKGEYVLLDRSCSDVCSATLFQLPTKMGKGILVSPTCHGNIIVGPTALDVESKEATETTYDGLQEVIAKAKLTVPTLPTWGIITQFSGLRAHSSENDFKLEWSKNLNGLFNLIGIESPGLASSPAIAEYTAGEVAAVLGLKQNPNFNPIRHDMKRIAHLSKEELEQAIKENPDYGRVVCRCEVVSAAEIKEALNRVPCAVDMDGVKRRTRAGMGRCQMGFCTPKVMEIIAEQKGIELKDITKKGHESCLLVGGIKQ